MSGSSCATTGSPIVSSGPTTTSLSTVATPGTNSSISLGPSCRSACATGPTGSDQRDSVLAVLHGRLCSHRPASGVSPAGARIVVPASSRLIVLDLWLETQLAHYPYRCCGHDC